MLYTRLANHMGNTSELPLNISISRSAKNTDNGEPKQKKFSNWTRWFKLKTKYTRFKMYLLLEKKKKIFNSPRNLNEFADCSRFVLSENRITTRAVGTLYYKNNNNHRITFIQYFDIYI